MASALTRNRAFSLVKSAAPTEGQPKVYTFRASDGDFDRANDRIDAKGWNVKAFNANPVIFYNHNTGLGLFSDPKSLPIGKGHAYPLNGELLVDITFDQQDPFAKAVESKVDQGILNTVSVGFRAQPADVTENEKGGYDFKAAELLEISIVSIPMNQRAVRVKGGEDSDEFFDHLAAAIERRTNKSTNLGHTAREEQNKMTPEEIKALVEKAAKDAIAAKMIADEQAAKAATEKAAIEKAAIEKFKAEQVDAAKGSRDSVTSATDGVIVGKPVIQGHKGMLVARFLQAKAISKLDGRDLRDVIKAQGDEVLTKALQQNTFTGFGSLVHEIVSSDFVELLRNTAVVRRAGPRQISLKGGTLRFDRQSGAASASYGPAEGSSITKSTDPATDAFTMSEKKLTGLLPLSNDLIRNASDSAQEMIKSDLGKVMALAEDDAFLFGAGGLAPIGLYFQPAAANKYAMTALTTAKTPTVQEAKTELNKALKTVKKANVPLTKFAWFINPDVEFAILNAVPGGGEGVNSLERELVERGTLRGKPVYVTNQIPSTLQQNLKTGGNKTAIFGVDMDEVIVADWLDLQLEVFENGTYKDGSGNLQSGISNDQTVIRAISKHDIALRHNVSEVIVYDTTWGT
jgi:HK97 family phage major capsid protein/HK97 family phage prohead protease